MSNDLDARLRAVLARKAAAGYDRARRERETEAREAEARRLWAARLVPMIDEVVRALSARMAAGGVELRPGSDSADRGSAEARLDYDLYLDGEAARWMATLRSRTAKAVSFRLDPGGKVVLSATLPSRSVLRSGLDAPDLDRRFDAADLTERTVKAFVVAFLEAAIDGPAAEGDPTDPAARPGAPRNDSERAADRDRRAREATSARLRGSARAPVPGVATR